MANTITKNIILSHPAVVQSEEKTIVPTLAHTTSQDDTKITVNIEIPGVDPTTVDVNCDQSILTVSCPKGAVSIALDRSTDISKIEADILWGLLTIQIPRPETPPSQNIKVSIHDTVRKNPPKKFTEAA